MEWSAFQEAKQWKVGPEYFVTRDKGIMGGVLPERILKMLE